MILVMSASASVIDIYDYGSVTTNGTTDIISVGLLNSLNEWRRTDNSSGSEVLVQTAVSDFITSNIQEGLVDNNIFRFYPFGFGNAVSTAGMDATINSYAAFDVFYRTVFPVKEGYNIKFELVLHRGDSAGNNLGGVVVDSYTHVQTSAENINITVPLEFDDILVDSFDVGSFCFVVVVSFSGIDDDADTSNVTLRCASRYNLNLSYSSLYRQQQLTGETNKILDQIANGSVDPVAPPDSPVVDDYVGSEQIVVDGAMDDFYQGLDHGLNVQEILPRYGQGLLAASWMIESVVGVGFFDDLIRVMLVFGFLLTLYGLGQILMRRSSSKKDGD